jgi:tetratricopeptide (TPR) repeat protein
MIDAETGAHVGTGRIHVQDHDELKLRMHELARQTGAPPAEQERLARQGKESEKAIVEARLLVKSGDFVRAAEVARAALKAAPDVVALQVILNDAERQTERAQIEATRQQAAARRAAEAEAARRRMAELTASAEAARARAAEEARNRGEAARRLQEQDKQRAYARLEAQGRAALAAGRYAEAVVALQSAVNVQANDDAFRELARARSSAEAAEQARAAEEKRQRDLAEQRRREQAQARLQQEEKIRREAEEAARQSRRERDAAEANRFTDQARQALAKQDFATALVAATSAAHLRDDPATRALIQKVQQEQELAEARKKGEQARAEAERRLAGERARREKAEAEARQKQEAYNAALGRAQKDLGERHYDQAISAFQEAAKIYRTDAALDGLKQAEQARDRERSLAQAEQRRKAEEAQRSARVKELADAGRRALEAKQFDKAVQSLAEASKLAPSDVDVRATLAKAEQSRDQAKEAAAAAARQREEEVRAEKVRPYVIAARKAIFAKDFDAAAKALGEANRLEPGEATVLKAAQELAAARTVQAAVEKDQKKRLADYELAMGAGRAAERAKNLTGAVNAYTEALRILPNDPAAGQALRQARAALEATKPPPPPPAPKPATVPAPLPTTAPKPSSPPPNPAAEYAKRMQEGAERDRQKKYAEAAASYREALKFSPGDARATEALRVAEFSQHLAEASRLHATKKFADAAREYEEALKRSPNDAAVKKLLQKAKENKLP